MARRDSASNMLLSPTNMPSSPSCSASLSSLPPICPTSRKPHPSDDTSYDLLPPPLSTDTSTPEVLAQRILGPSHLATILAEPLLLSNFAEFLAHRDGDGIKALICYLDAKKALKALAYSNAIMGDEMVVRNELLEKRQHDASDALLEELAAYVTHSVVEVVSKTVAQRVTAVAGREVTVPADDGLGECFCLTDPGRDGNPIIFMSEEFNRVTQYGVSYAVGRNCRFLQGPQTDRKTVNRLKQAIDARQETSEVFLNYRRDGSPFFNLLLVAPLFDSQGRLRYYIGAQVDVTQVLYDGAGMDSLAPGAHEEELSQRKEEKDVFRELTELFNDTEIETSRLYGGRMHNGRRLRREGATRGGRDRSRSRVVLKEGTPTDEKTTFMSPKPAPTLKGVYQNYLLVRPYPSLKILFTSPSLRTPGIHQLHLLHKIGGSNRVREELHEALRAGKGVTAKVLWLTNRDTENGGGSGRERWVHCTPLLDATGEVGVWMVIVVDPPGEAVRREMREVVVDAAESKRRRELSMCDLGDSGSSRPPTALEESPCRHEREANGGQSNQPDDCHFPPHFPARLPPTPTSPVPRIVSHDIEVNLEVSIPPIFRLSDHIPPRRSSRGQSHLGPSPREGSVKKYDVDLFARNLGMLAAN